MADVAKTSASGPGGSFAAFLALEAEERKKVLARTHALYGEAAATAQIFLDAYEGCGGFATGEYLWKYPREEDPDFKLRKEQARYHNYAKSLVNLYVRHVMHQKIDRRSDDQALKDFWEDVDGAKTSITDFMTRAAHLALAMGYEGILADKTTDAPTGPAKADERARPILVLYHPQHVVDWRHKRDELVAIKLKEEISSDDILAKTEAADDCQYLIWSKTEGWIRVTEEGELVTDDGSQGFDNPGLDLVPFTMLRPEASAANPFLGQSLLGNANVFRALFNRCSEEDNVLRDSSWSMLTVSVDKEGDVAEVKTQVGTEVGTTRAIIAKGQIEWKGPDQAVPKSIRDAIQFLVQEIYRMAHVTYQRDSRDAESAEALRIKHSELNEMLVGLANAMQQVEEQIAKFYYAWTTTSADAAESAFKAANVSIEYPNEFFIKDLLEELQVWAEAIALDLGLTFTQRIKVKAAKTLDPEMDEETLKKVTKEIEAQPAAVPLNAPGADAAALRDRAAGRLQKFTTEGAADNPIVQPAGRQAAAGAGDTIAAA